MDKNFKRQIRASDKRILAALETLQGSPRGLVVLIRFKDLANTASGLDTQGMKALVTLTKEFTGGRRNFLEVIARA